MKTVDNKAIPSSARMDPETWQLLAAQLNARGKPLDALMPLYHVGGICAVPPLRCMGCRRPLEHREFTAVIEGVRNKPWYLNLKAACRCGDCEGVTLYLQTYAPPEGPLPSGPPPPLAPDLKDAPKADGLVTAPVRALSPPVSVFDLVAHARALVKRRGETLKDRMMPIPLRLRRRLAAGGGAGSIFLATLVSISLNLPNGSVQWDLGLVFSTWIKSAPLALGLALAYEICVLWATKVRLKTQR